MLVVHTDQLGGSVNADSDSEVLSWGLRVCISHRGPDDSEAAGLGTTLCAMRVQTAGDGLSP